MPYKHRTKLIPPQYDRRRKMTETDKVKALLMYHIDGESIRGIARKFKVDKRTIQFLLFPERLKKNREDREARGGWRQYYDRKANTDTAREHRRYKQKLMKAGVLQERTEKDV